MPRTPTVYTINNDDDDSDDEMAQMEALRNIQAGIQNSGDAASTPTAVNYGQTTMAWMTNEEEEEEELKGDTPSNASPKRTPLMQRSTTPIMSNSSSSHKHHRRDQSNSSSNAVMDDDDDDVVMDYTEPAPVETPMVPVRGNNTTGRASLGGGRKISYAASPGSTSMSSSSPSLSQNAFRRYHDALWSYLQVKRRLDTQIDLQQAEQTLALTDGSNGAAAGQGGGLFGGGMAANLTMTLPEQQSRAEVEFCKTLSQLGYSLSSSKDDTDSIEEGHSWRLLAQLRKLGVDALIWEDDSSSLTQQESNVSFFVRPLTTKVRATPKEIIKELTTSPAASKPLKRKHLLVQWIQACLEQESKEQKAQLPRGSSPSFTSSSHLDDPNPPALAAEMDGKILKMLMETCLNEVLEGNISTACELAKSHGQPLKASLWSGGQPYGYETVLDDETKTVDKVPIGNPNRFLWKRQVWKTGRRVLQQQEQQQQMFGSPSSSSLTAMEEAAIYSILANDVKTSMANPLIRSSWSKSLCVMLMGVWDRIQDEILHSHSASRRRSPPPGYPGSQYEDEENEQLMETSGLAGMKEAQIATQLASNPFLQQQKWQKEESEGPSVSYKSAMLAFVVGRSAIANYCTNATNQMLSSTNWAFTDTIEGKTVYADSDWKGLRFLTHLVLFLDSFDVSTAQVRTSDLTHNKNKILFDYIRYMESRPDLWRMLALYVSLLPHAKVLEYYPGVLARVLNSTERKKMMDQIRELMPTLELPLLRKVVRILLATQDFGSESDKTLDEIKLNSLEWLLQDEQHYGDALICSNIFMRELLLVEDEDKMDLAMHFLNECLPPTLAEDAAEMVRANDTDDEDADYVAKVSNARWEHYAYVSYLEAYHAFEHWKNVLNQTPTTVENSLSINTSALNDTERGIADRTIQKNWIREKKALFDKVIATAKEARSAINKVLTHPGGWLSLDDDDDIVDLSREASDNEEHSRKEEMKKIRYRHLVLAVNLYHQVCEDTASWISRSYDDAWSVGLARDQVLSMLDSDVPAAGPEGGDAAVKSPFSPKFWYQHVMQLTTLVANDSFGIYKAFLPGDLKDFLSKIAETAVAELLNA